MSKKGMKLSKEHCRKISEANTGRKRPDMIGNNNPMRRSEIAAKLTGENNPAKRPGVRAKISSTRKGMKFSEEHCKNISLAKQNISKETREKMSLARKGKKLSEATKSKISISISGKNHPMYGKHHTEESKIKVSKTKLNQNLRISDKHKQAISLANKDKKMSNETKQKISCFAQGITLEEWSEFISCKPYCQAWIDKEYRESIKERDNYECQNPDCWKTSGIICIHHIDYNKKNCVPLNLITLCNSCNSRANYNKEYWIEMYAEIIQNTKAAY